jgi:hypothetical protein
VATGLSAAAAAERVVVAPSAEAVRFIWGMAVLDALLAALAAERARVAMEPAGGGAFSSMRRVVRRVCHVSMWSVLCRV